MIGADAPPLTKPIQTILVYKKNPQTKELAYIDWKPAEQLDTLQKLLDGFGPGTYKLSGRLIDRRTIVREVMQVVGENDLRQAALMAPAAAPRELDVAKVVGAVTAALGPVLAFVSSMIEARRAERNQERQLERERLAAERERDDKRQETLLGVVTQTMSARMGDLENMIRGASSSKDGGGPSEAKAYKDGLADAMVMLDTLRESGAIQPQAEQQILELVKAFAGGAGQAKAAPPPVPPSPRKDEESPL